MFLLFLLSEWFKPVVISIMKATHLQPVYKYNRQTVGNREAKYHTDKKGLKQANQGIFQTFFLQKYRYVHKNAKMTTDAETDTSGMHKWRCDATVFPNTCMQK